MSVIVAVAVAVAVAVRTTVSVSRAHRFPLGYEIECLSAVQ
ncbi:hypothetical protein AB0I99_25000 [Streptomyces spongiicola]